MPAFKRISKILPWVSAIFHWSNQPANRFLVADFLNI